MYLSFLMYLPGCTWQLPLSITCWWLIYAQLSYNPATKVLKMSSLEFATLIVMGKSVSFNRNKKLRIHEGISGTENGRCLDNAYYYCYCKLFCLSPSSMLDSSHIKTTLTYIQASSLAIFVMVQSSFTCSDLCSDENTPQTPNCHSFLEWSAEIDSVHRDILYLVDLSSSYQSHLTRPQIHE